MWVRFGNWVELGVHFGRQNTLFNVFDRSLVHASLRFGKSEWSHGPRRPIRPINTSLGSLNSSRIDLYPDPEPLSWGISKAVSAATYSMGDTKHRSASR